jgi:hypothetical protein
MLLKVAKARTLVILLSESECQIGEMDYKQSMTLDTIADILDEAEELITSLEACFAATNRCHDH